MEKKGLVVKERNACTNVILIAYEKGVGKIAVTGEGKGKFGREGGAFSHNRGEEEAPRVRESTTRKKPLLKEKPNDVKPWR